MYRFLCRILTLVFVTNTLLSTPSFAQTPNFPSEVVQHRTYPIINQPAGVQPDSTEQVYKQAKLAMQKATTAEEYQIAMLARHNALNKAAMDEANELAQQEWDRTNQAVRELAAKGKSAIQQAPGYSDHFLNVELGNLKKDEVMILTRDRQWHAQEDSGKANAVYQAWGKGTVTLDRLVDYIDPFEPRYFDRVYDTIYAAEMMENSLNAFRLSKDKQVPMMTEKESENWLMKLQQRTWYRYVTLLFQTEDTGSYLHNITLPLETAAKAKGALRSLLLTIHLFYEAKGWQDPMVKPLNPAKAESARKALCAESPTQRKAREEIMRQYRQNMRDYNKRKAEVNAYNAGIKDSVVFRFVGNKPKKPTFERPICAAPTPMGWNDNLYENFLQEYLKELAAAKDTVEHNRGFFTRYIGAGLMSFAFETLPSLFFPSHEKEMKQGAQMQEALFTAQYAGIYATKYGKGMDEMVMLFEKGGNWTEDNMFDKDKFDRPFAVFQNTILTSMYDTAIYTLTPNGQKIVDLLIKYATPSNKYSFPLQVFALEKLGQIAANETYANRLSNTAQEARLDVINNIPLSTNQRARFAQYAVDLYAEMQRHHNYKDHDLNAEKMAVLSGNLVRIHAMLTNSGFLDAKGNFLVGPMYSQGRIFAPGTYLPGGGVGYETRDSHGNQVFLNIDPAENSSKKVDDVIKEVARFAVDIAVWTYGFNLVGKAVTAAGRFTKGAVVAMPKMARVLRTPGATVRMSREGTSAIVKAEGQAVASSTSRVKQAANVLKREVTLQNEVSDLSKNMTSLVRVSGNSEEAVVKQVVAGNARGVVPMAQNGAMGESITSASQLGKTAAQVEGKAAAEEVSYEFYQRLPGGKSVSGKSTFAEPVTAENWETFKNSFRAPDGSAVTWRDLTAQERELIRREQQLESAAAELATDRGFVMYTPNANLSTSKVTIFDARNARTLRSFENSQELGGAVTKKEMAQFGNTLLVGATPVKEGIAFRLKMGNTPLLGGLGPKPSFAEEFPAGTWPFRSLGDVQTAFSANWTQPYVQHLISERSLDVLSGHLMTQLPLWNVVKGQLKWMGGFALADFTAKELEMLLPALHVFPPAEEERGRQVTRVREEVGFHETPQKKNNGTQPVALEEVVAQNDLLTEVNGVGNDSFNAASIKDIMYAINKLKSPDDFLLTGKEKGEFLNAMHNLAVEDMLSKENPAVMNQVFKKGTVEAWEKMLSKLLEIKEKEGNQMPSDARKVLKDTIRQIRTGIEHLKKAQGKPELNAESKRLEAIFEQYKMYFESKNKEVIQAAKNSAKGEMNLYLRNGKYQPYGPDLLEVAKLWNELVDQAFEKASSLEERKRLLANAWNTNIVPQKAMQRETARLAWTTLVPLDWIKENVKNEPYGNAALAQGKELEKQAVALISSASFDSEHISSMLDYQLKGFLNKHEEFARALIYIKVINWGEHVFLARLKKGDSSQPMTDYGSFLNKTRELLKTEGTAAERKIEMMQMELESKYLNIDIRMDDNWD